MKKSIKSGVGLSHRAASRSKQKPLSISERFALGFAIGGSKEIIGQTIFGDRPLRFRALTPSEVDVRLLETAPGIDRAFKIRVAKPGAIREPGVGAERRYGGPGYKVPGLHRGRSLVTFLAYDEGKIVGTVGVRLDSSKGLPADRLYREELDSLRAEGRRLCELAHLAVDATTTPRPVLASLFHSAYLYAGVVSGFTHAVIQVHSRHVPYYKRAVGFEPVRAQRVDKGFIGPAALLCGSFALIAEGIARDAGRRNPQGARTSLFIDCFPRDVEQGVLKRIRLFAQT